MKTLIAISLLLTLAVGASANVVDKCMSLQDLAWLMAKHQEKRIWTGRTAFTDFFRAHLYQSTHGSWTLVIESAAAVCVLSVGDEGTDMAGLPT
jgi:hypothetical protein